MPHSSVAAHRLQKAIGHGSHGDPTIARTLNLLQGGRASSTPSSGNGPQLAAGRTISSTRELSASTDPVINRDQSLVYVTGRGVFQFVDYRLVSGSTPPAANGQTVLTTSVGGNTRWVRSA